MTASGKIKIVEVGPRDGLQNEPMMVPAAIKIELIERLAQAGCKTIEATSFVAPDRIPQLADHEEVFTSIKPYPDVSYPVLVPNMRGFNNALAAGVKEISVFGAASETFSQKNINCSIGESIQRFTKVITAAKAHDMKVRGYVSCVLGCPYEGEIRPQVVADLAGQLYDLGCYEISLGDTIGVGTAKKAQKLIDIVSQKVPINYLAAHFHDTYGQALANLFAVIQLGIRIIDSAVGGLGGCPYAVGASGNVATEDVIYMLNGLGFNTGVDLQKLIKASYFINDYLNRKPTSKVALAYLRKI